MEWTHGRILRNQPLWTLCRRQSTVKRSVIPPPTSSTRGCPTRRRVSLNKRPHPLISHRRPLAKAEALLLGARRIITSHRRWVSLGLRFPDKDLPFFDDYCRHVIIPRYHSALSIASCPSDRSVTPRSPFAVDSLDRHLRVYSHSRRTVSLHRCITTPFPPSSRHHVPKHPHPRIARA